MERKCGAGETKIGWIRQKEVQEMDLGFRYKDTELYVGKGDKNEGIKIGSCEESCQVRRKNKAIKE